MTDATSTNATPDERVAAAIAELEAEGSPVTVAAVRSRSRVKMATVADAVRAHKEQQDRQSAEDDVLPEPVHQVAQKAMGALWRAAKAEAAQAHASAALAWQQERDGLIEERDSLDAALTAAEEEAERVATEHTEELRALTEKLESATAALEAERAELESERSQNTRLRGELAGVQQTVAALVAAIPQTAADAPMDSEQ